VLFDHDGVLADTEPLRLRAWQLLFEDLDLPDRALSMAAVAGRSAATVLGEFLPPGAASLEDVCTLAARQNDYYLRMALAAPLFGGVHAHLLQLRALGVRIGIVSNAPRKTVRAMMDELGLWDLLDVLVAGGETAAPKPHASPYCSAAGGLGLAPEECVAIEASRPGLASALQAGLYTCAVTTTFGAAELRDPVPGRPDLQAPEIAAGTAACLASIVTALEPPVRASESRSVALRWLP
jgi:HAD superfamily hydrolase (TIGR01509 family)